MPKFNITVIQTAVYHTEIEADDRDMAYQEAWKTYRLPRDQEYKMHLGLDGASITSTKEAVRPDAFTLSHSIKEEV